MYQDHILPILALTSITTGRGSYTFFRCWLDNSKFLGCDNTGMVTLGDGMQAYEASKCKPPSAVYPQRNLNLECWFALAFFVHLMEKENDDVTKMKFVNLWGWFAYLTCYNRRPLSNKRHLSKQRTPLMPLSAY